MSHLFFLLMTLIYTAAMIFVFVYYTVKGEENALDPDDPDIIPINVSGRAGRLMLLLWGQYALTVLVLSVFEFLLGR